MPEHDPLSKNVEILKYLVVKLHLDTLRTDTVCPPAIDICIYKPCQYLLTSSRGYYKGSRI